MLYGVPLLLGLLLLPRITRCQEWSWLANIPLALVFGIGMFWFQPRVDAAIGSVWGKVATWGGLFIVVWIVVLVVMLSQRDRVVAQARAMARRGEDEGAIELLRKAIEEEPKAMRLGVLGVVLGKVRRYAEAEAAFARAQELEDGPVYFVPR